MLIDLDDEFREYAKTRSNSILNEDPNKFLNLLIDTGATIVVGTTSLLNGLFGTLESVMDGILTALLYQVFF